MMINLSKVKELKEAGLKWKPEFGDLYLLVIDDLENIYCYDEGIQACIEAKEMGAIWIPSLSQLLAEIEVRGYDWELLRMYTGRYIVEIWPKDRDGIMCSTYQNYANTREDVVAGGLLYLLKQEGLICP